MVLTIDVGHPPRKPEKVEREIYNAMYMGTGQPRARRSETGRIVTVDYYARQFLVKIMIYLMLRHKNYGASADSTLIRTSGEITKESPSFG
jgi:hypothetical protein